MRTLPALAAAALVADRVRLRAVYRQREAEMGALVETQTALHDVAALVARGAPLEALCARVARSAAALLDGEVALVLRYDEQMRAQLVGRWVRDIENYPEPGGILDFAPTSAIGSVLRTRRTARVAAGTPSPFQDQLSERVATPIELDGRLWGALAVGGAVGLPLPGDCEARIERFAELVALAIANAEARAQLVTQANTDPLTGLANHRAFSERLAAEVARADRYGRPVALIAFDVDRFKLVNDTDGHLSGDHVLVEVAARLTEAIRTDALLGRLGGDEFAAVLPECDAETALRVAERARAAVAAQPIGGRRVTLSAGVSGLTGGQSVEDLIAHADEALYAAKAAGRDTCQRHGPALRAA